MKKLERPNQLAEELVGERLDKIRQLTNIRKRNQEVTDLILGLSTALALVATMFLKKTNKQPHEFGKRAGEHITEVMQLMYKNLETKGLMRYESNSEDQTDDPWG